MPAALAPNEALAVAVTFIAASAVLLNLFKPRKIDSWPVIPGGLFFLGNALQIGGLSRLYEQLYVWAEEYGRDQGVFQFSLLGTRFLVVCRQDRILELMKHRPLELVRSAKAKSVANSIGAKGLFAAEGQQWRIDRRMVAPALNRKNIRTYLDSMKVVAQRLVRKWQAASASSVSINSDLYSLSIDTLSLAVNGKDANTLEHEVTDQTSKDVVAILDVAMTRMFSPLPYWEVPYIGAYLDGGGFVKDRLVRALDAMITHQLEKKPTSASETFLAKILALNQESEQSMPRERLIGQLLTLFLGGSDSVGTLLTTAFWQLAADHELQDELFQEVREKLLRGAQNATMEDLTSQLPRMRSFLMELGRCYGPSPVIFLGAAEDVPFGSTDVIPSGTEVVLLTRTANMHPTAPPADIPAGPYHGEGANEFCPHRWLVNTSGDGSDNPNAVDVKFPSLQSGVHMSFGHGVRMCPGKDLAELEMLNCLANVLERFHISLDPDRKNAALHDVELLLRERG